MEHSIEQIVQNLKETRKRKKLSQRKLAEMAGVPQSHISKIESGAVDLRLSSLIEISRALDLEVSLVPRRDVPAVQSIIRRAVPDTEAANTAMKELQLIQKSLNQFSLATASKELDQFQSRTRELQRLKLPTSSLKDIKQANNALEQFKLNTDTSLLKKALKEMQSLRNSIAHGGSNSSITVRPAYSLEEEDDD